MNFGIPFGSTRRVLLGLALTTFAQAQTLAFPEALGFGAKATGGRAGTVYHVTNLDDAGTGSFRDAVSKPNRIVVFDVGGYITLKTAVAISGNITIAGQTAPGQGIGIKSGKLSLGANSNIVLRYLRMRAGSETASTNDVGLNLLNARNVIVDHCSIEFAPYDNIDGVSTAWQTTPVTDITFQSNLIANPIGQQFGAHCESVQSDWAWYYNAFVNSHNRNPLAKTNTVYVNNVNYGNEADYTTHTSTAFKHDIVNNYFILSTASGSANTWFQIDANQSIYASGNLRDADKDGTLGGTVTNVSWYNGTGTILTSAWSDVTKNNPVHTPATAFRLVVSRAGALPWDAMDSLVWRQVNSLGKEGKIYTSQTETGLANNGYGTISGGTRPTDSDNDGMPDFWEAATGSDASKDDAMAIGSDGYAKIEQYLNWLGAVHARVPKNGSVDIDLLAAYQGFKSVSPTFTVSDATGGAASVLADKKTARFAPTANTTGRASFAFTVKGSDGTSYTGSVSVLVEPSDLSSSVGASARPDGWRLDLPSRLPRSGDRVGYAIPEGPATLVVRTLSGIEVSRQGLSGTQGSVEIAGWGRAARGGYVLAIQVGNAVRVAERIHKID